MEYEIMCIAKAPMIALIFILFTSGVSAKEKGGYFQVGYGSVKIASETSGAVVVDFGGKFGETYKQSIGFCILFCGENDDWSDGEGNVGEVYYALGYEIVDGMTVLAKVGYAFEDTGAVYGTTTYVSGITYGAIVKYALGDSFDVVATYTHGSLRFESIEHTIDAIDVGIAYIF